MPLATMTMKTQTHGFLNFYPRTVVMGLRSAALRAAVELRYQIISHLKFYTTGEFNEIQTTEPVKTCASSTQPNKTFSGQVVSHKQMHSQSHELRCPFPTICGSCPV